MSQLVVCISSGIVILRRQLSLNCDLIFLCCQAGILRHMYTPFQGLLWRRKILDQLGIISQQLLRSKYATNQFPTHQPKERQSELSTASKRLSITGPGPVRMMIS